MVKTGKLGSDTFWEFLEKKKESSGQPTAPNSTASWPSQLGSIFLAFLLLFYGIQFSQRFPLKSSSPFSLLSFSLWLAEKEEEEEEGIVEFAQIQFWWHKFPAICLLLLFYENLCVVGLRIGGYEGGEYAAFNSRVCACNEER